MNTRAVDDNVEVNANFAVCSANDGGLSPDALSLGRKCDCTKAICICSKVVLRLLEATFNLRHTSKRHRYPLY